MKSTCRDFLIDIGFFSSNTFFPISVSELFHFHMASRKKNIWGNAMSVREIDSPVMMLMRKWERVHLTSPLIWFHLPNHIGTFSMNFHFTKTEHPSQIEHNTPFTVVLVVVAHSDAHSNVPSFCDAKEMNYTPSTRMEVIEIMIYSPLMVYHSTAHVIGAVFSLHPSFSISF